MVPNIDVQLQAVLKALRDVVTPAIDPSNPLAREQLHLSITTLDMVRSRIPLVHACARRELSNALAMAHEVRDAGAEELRNCEDIVKARAALLDPVADACQLDAVRIALLGVVADIVASRADDHSRLAIERAIIRHTRSQTNLARAWCEPAGFEINQGALDDLNNLLNACSRDSGTQT